MSVPLLTRSHLLAAFYGLSFMFVLLQLNVVENMEEDARFSQNFFVVNKDFRQVAQALHICGLGVAVVYAVVMVGWGDQQCQRQQHLMSGRRMCRRMSCAQPVKNNDVLSVVCCTGWCST